MDCDSCEMLLFLKVNRQLWADLKMFDEILRATDSAVAEEDEDDDN